jgi:hypothetical protein
MTQSETRRCPFCKANSGLIVHDDAHLRAYECQTCLAVEKITKTEKSGWWYHGWQALDDDDLPGFRRDADGKTEQAPIHFAKWVRDIPPDCLSR